MAIRGLTHDEQGNARVTRTVTVKLAIGLPPVGEKGHPTRIDHFIFLRKELQAKDVRWIEDPEMTEHYKQAAVGEPVREVWITFLDDSPEQVFRTEYAAWMARGKWCCGDGKTAQRRNIENGAWGPLKVYDGPCENDGCPEVDAGRCGPSGDLYFMLNDFPALGTICRIHTGSYQSIRQISSALQDLARITGGRLTGISAKLFLAADRNRYTNDAGARVTGAPKWILGLELAAADLPKLSERMLATSVAFQQIRQLAAGPIEEDDTERAREIVGEFYPPPAADQAREDELRAVAVRLMTERWNLDEPRQQYCLEQYRGRLGELIERMQNTLRKTEAMHDGKATILGEHGPAGAEAGDKPSGDPGAETGGAIEEGASGPAEPATAASEVEGQLLITETDVAIATDVTDATLASPRGLFP